MSFKVGDYVVVLEPSLADLVGATVIITEISAQDDPYFLYEIKYCERIAYVMDREIRYATGAEILAAKLRGL